jgi:hypothetical protein
VTDLRLLRRSMSAHIWPPSLPSFHTHRPGCRAPFCRRSLGCQRVVNYRQESLREVLRREYPKGIDVVYESGKRCTAPEPVHCGHSCTVATLPSACAVVACLPAC